MKPIVKGMNDTTVHEAPPSAVADTASLASQAQPRPRHNRLTQGRIAVTLLHLFMLSAVGTAVGSVAVTLFAAGVSTLVLLGVGAVLLVGLVYLLFATGWFEIERVRGLYGFEVPPLRLRPRAKPGFVGWLAAIGKQSIDGRMWLALLNFSLGSLFGLFSVQMVMLAAWNFALAISGHAGGTALGMGGIFGITGGFPVPTGTAFFSSPWWPLGAAVVQLATVWGLAAVHAVLSRTLLGSASRNELAEQVRTQSAQRVGAVRAADVERTRIERDLHDGVQPRLVSIGMTLGMADQKIDTDPATAKALIREAHTSTKAAITELRQLARGIHTSVLDDRGLDAALSALAGRSHIPVVLDVQLTGADQLRQHPSTATAFRDAEAAMYFSIAEALTNAAKHSRAAQCTVQVRVINAGTPHAQLWARIEDNGIGGATVQPGGGLDGMSNRVLAAGGTFQLHSAQGGPTAVEVTVPCAF